MVEDAQADRYRWLQRLLEIVPGLISWAIILGPIWLSFSYPWLVAYFVLTFDFYMLCRSLWLAVTVVIGYRRVRRVEATDWMERLRGHDFAGASHALRVSDEGAQDAAAPDWTEMVQLALIPTYTESLATLRETVRALAVADWPKERKICAIITRETDEQGRANVATLRAEFGDAFADFIHVLDPLEPGIVIGKRLAERLRERRLVDPVPAARPARLGMERAERPVRQPVGEEVEVVEDQERAELDRWVDRPADRDREDRVGAAIAQRRDVRLMGDVAREPWVPFAVA